MSRTTAIVTGTVIGAILLFCGLLVGAFALFTSDDEPGGSPEAGQDPSELSTTGRDGQFEFTVNGLECGVAEIGDEFLSESAQGEFCLIDVTVSNIGDEPRTLDQTVQKAFDTQGREFSTTDTLGVAVDNPETWYTEINPGNQVSGTLVYDVPPGTDLAKLQLHDSAASGGVEVAVP